MCINQNNRRMKTILLVVGRTVEQHYITAINDYIQRTKRYITFDMEVIPELKNTKSLSMEVQKEKADIFSVEQAFRLDHDRFGGGALRHLRVRGGDPEPFTDYRDEDHKGYKPYEHHERMGQPVAYPFHAADEFHKPAFFGRFLLHR